MENKRAINKLKALCVLNILDAFFTTILITRFGLESEINPFVKESIETIGLIPSMLLKAILIAAVLYFVAYRIKTKKVVGKLFLIGTNIMIFCYTLLVLVLFGQVILM